MKITVEKHIAAPIADVWRTFNEPDDIVQWDGSDRWQIVGASNDLEVGGQLVLRIKPKDGGEAFDLPATYSRIEPRQLLEFQLQDDRTALMEFIETESGVTFRQTFDADPTQPESQERSEWQGVLDRFARYVESPNQRLQLTGDARS